jgi:Na+/melibiose symporter-like transporter
VSKVLFFFGYQVGAVMAQMSVFYITTYLLDAPASDISILMGTMLAGALISVPIWMIISQKVNNNRKISLVCGLLMFFAFLPMIFVNNLLGWGLALVAFGIALGGQWFMDPPTMGDVLDDVAAKTGKRDPGVYFGYQALFSKLGQTSIVATIATVHSLTGFVSGAPSLEQLMALSPTPELALFGIRIHAAIVPALIVLIATLLFWRFYDLTPDKVAENKVKLKELGI